MQLLLLSLSISMAFTRPVFSAEGLYQGDASGINVSEEERYKQIYDKCKSYIEGTLNISETSGSSDFNIKMSQCISTGEIQNAAGANGQDAAQVTEGLNKLSEQELEALAKSKEKDCVFEGVGEERTIKCEDAAEQKRDYQQDQLDTAEFQSPEMRKLGEYIKKRLYEALYGSEETAPDSNNRRARPNQQKKVVDHKVYVDLYKTAVGKSIVSTLTNYCIEADQFGIVRRGEEKNNRESNVKALKDFNPQDKSPVASERFNLCITQVKHICSEKKLYGTTNFLGVPNVDTCAAYIKADKTAAYFTPKYLPRCNERIIEKFSQDKACLAVAKLKKLRGVLTKLEKTEEQYAFLEQRARETGGYKIGQGGAFKEAYDSSEQGKSVDDLTALTSKDLKDSQALDEIEAQKEKLKQACLQEDGTVDPAKANSDECKDYRGELGEEEFEKLIAEQRARKHVGLARISQIKDEGQLETYLKATGLNEQEAKSRSESLLALAKTENPGSSTESIIKEIRKKLNDQFSHERDAVIAELNQKIGIHTLEEENTSNQNTTSNSAVATSNPEVEGQQKVEEIQEEFNQKSEKFKQLVHFNNIIQGYLSVNDSNGVQSRNTQALFRELDTQGEAFNESAASNRSPSDANGNNSDVESYTKEDFDQLKEAVEQNDTIQRGASTRGAGAVTLDKDQLKGLIDVGEDPVAAPAQSQDNSGSP